MIFSELFSSRRSRFEKKYPFSPSFMPKLLILQPLLMQSDSGSQSQIEITITCGFWHFHQDEKVVSELLSWYQVIGDSGVL